MDSIVKGLCGGLAIGLTANTTVSLKDLLHARMASVNGAPTASTVTDGATATEEKTNKLDNDEEPEERSCPFPHLLSLDLLITTSMLKAQCISLSY